MGPKSRTLIHLVRHAEVENPDNILYGRLEGFALSDRGQRQAGALGSHFSKAKLSAVYSSPLARAMQTAEAISKPHDLLAVEDPNLIESHSKLQGNHGDLRMFVNPLNLLHFRNPFRPSWGEDYDSIAKRMLRAIQRMLEAHSGTQVVAVSHMTPIAVARLRADGQTIPPWAAGKPCARASVSTLTYENNELEDIEYVEVGSPLE